MVPKAELPNFEADFERINDILMKLPGLYHFCRALRDPVRNACYLDHRGINNICLFPQIRGPILVVPIIRTIIYFGLFWGPLFMEAPVWPFGSFSRVWAILLRTFFLK